MIIKPPKPGLGFGIRDFGFWILDLVWLWLGVWQKRPKISFLGFLGIYIQHMGANGGQVGRRGQRGLILAKCFELNQHRV